jgi:hypothetical protein
MCLDSDWENPASRELVEGFLRRRLEEGPGRFASIASTLTTAES